MERRRILKKTYRVKNISDRDLEFALTLNNGERVEFTLSEWGEIRGVERNGLRLLQPWIYSGELQIEQEWEWAELNNKHNWAKEGF